MVDLHNLTVAWREGSTTASSYTAPLAPRKSSSTTPRWRFATARRTCRIVFGRIVLLRVYGGGVPFCLGMIQNASLYVTTSRFPSEFSMPSPSTYV